MKKELPIGWVETKLGVIAEWGSGGTPNRSESKYYNGTIPWVKTGDLNDSIILEAGEYITEFGLKNSSAKLFPKGSIIVAMYGATIGKTAKLGIDATTNQACAVAKASAIVIPEFLHYFLKSEKQKFIDKGKGGAQPNISQTVIKEHPFPLAPLPEQQRIVAKLDALFGHLDALKTRLDRIPQLLKDFRQKVLTQAVTGKLTEEWRCTDSVEKITSITIGDEYDIAPKKWQWVKLIDIAKLESGHTPRKTVPEYWNNGNVPWISLQDIRAVNGMEITKTKFMPNTLGIENSSARLLPKGTVCFCRDISVGFVTIMGIQMSTSQHFANWICGNRLNNRFLMYAFMASIQSLIASGTGTTVGTIYYPALKEMRILLPPIEEQQEIVRRVESLFAKADQIEASYQKLKTKIEQLPQALLAKAFRGELVEQLPTDGDAHQLLEEIRKAKAGLEKGGKTRKLKVG